MNFVMEVIHHMKSKFEVGQSIQFIKEKMLVTGVYRDLCGDGPKASFVYTLTNGKRVFHCVAECLITPIVCPVCSQDIVAENKKIKEHNYKNEVCYGSYTPI